MMKQAMTVFHPCPCKFIDLAYAQQNKQATPHNDTTHQHNITKTTQHHKNQHNNISTTQQQQQLNNNNNNKMRTQYDCAWNFFPLLFFHRQLFHT